jgi:DNA-binding LacI/PurR family transcriptional regulator
MPSKLRSSNQSVLERDWEKLLGTVVLDRSSGTPLHVQLSAALRKFISTTLANGEKFLPEGKIVSQLGLSLGTVRRALTVLTDEGLIERRRYHGTVVHKPEEGSSIRYITLVIPPFASVFFHLFLDALYEQADQIGALIRIVRLRQGQDWKDLSSHITYAPGKGGVILSGNDQQVTVDLNNILTQQGYRTVSLGPYINHYSGNYVGSSNRLFIEAGLKMLANQGHRRIAFLVSEPEERDEVRLRIRLFEEVAATMGLTEVEVFHAGTHEWLSSVKQAVEVMPRLWNRPNRPTAIFAVSDAAAVGALHWFHFQHIAVPKQVSIVSYDGSDWTRECLPELTSLVTSPDRIASEAFRLLLSESGKVEHFLIAPEFQKGETLALPPTDSTRS